MVALPLPFLPFGPTSYLLKGLAQHRSQETRSTGTPEAARLSRQWAAVAFTLVMIMGDDCHSGCIIGYAKNGNENVYDNLKVMIMYKHYYTPQYHNSH